MSFKLKDLCERCGKRPPNGSIGSLIDPSWSQNVCEQCYKEMGFKPLLDMSKEELRQMWQTFDKNTANISITEGSGSLDELLQSTTN